MSQCSVKYKINIYNIIYINVFFILYMISNTYPINTTTTTTTTIENVTTIAFIQCPPESLKITESRIF